MNFTEIPWITKSNTYIHCNICKRSAKLNTTTIEEFTKEHAEHKAPPTHYPVGDMVAKVTKMMGFIEKCSSCETRRYEWNNLIKR
jgi:hypothetical protein